MIIIGIDPGTRVCGFAVISTKNNASIDILKIGSWDLFKQNPELGQRLELLYDYSKKIFTEFNPTIIGIEKAVTHKNISASLKLSEARGIIRLAAHKTLDKAEDRILELSPTKVKKNASGMGLASKSSVNKVLELRFPNLKQSLGTNYTHDSIDALAIAWSSWVEFKSNKLSPPKRA